MLLTLKQPGCSRHGISLPPPLLEKNMDINLTPGTREALVNMITTAINEDRYPHADYHELQQLCEYWEKSLLAPPATSTSGATRINSARMDRNPAPCIFCSSKHLKVICSYIEVIVAIIPDHPFQCEPIQGYDNLCKRCQKKGYGECPTSPPLATTRQVIAITFISQISW